MTSISAPDPNAVNVASPPVGPTTKPSAEFLAWKVASEHKNKIRAFDLQILLGLWLLMLAIYHGGKRVSLIMTRRYGPQANINGGGYAYVRAFRASRALVRKYFLYVTVPTPFYIYTAPELLLLFIYFLILYILVVNDVSRSPLFAPANMTINGMGNRASTVFVATLPWLIALATKNNFLSWFSGVPYERLQIYHRSCSRISLSLVLIHVCIKLKASRSMTLDWRKWGVVAFFFASAIFVTSHRNGLNWFYQLFVHLHVPLVAGLFVAIWLHTVDTVLKDIIHPFLLASATIWGLDLFTRFAQLVFINALYLPKASNFKTSRLYILSREMVRVEIIRPGLQEWIPGSHVYLFSPPFFGVSPFWQSHPFTISSIPRTDHGGWRRGGNGPALGSREKKGYGGGTSGSEAMELQALRQGEPNEDPFGTSSTSTTQVFSKGTGSTAVSSRDLDERSKLTFLIKKRQGFTKKLYEAAQFGKSVNLLVYGPLSPPLSYLSSYETLVFFSGGSGVSWTLPLLLDVCLNKRNNYTFTRQIYWIWSVTNSEHMNWITQELSQALSIDMSKMIIDVRIHVTQETVRIRDPPRPWEEVVPANQSKSSSRQRAPWIVQGRPHVHGILSSAVESAGGRIWVGVSGPSSLKLAVRGAVRDWIQPQAVLRGDAKGDITLHAETFGW